MRCRTRPVIIVTALCALTVGALSPVAAHADSTDAYTSTAVSGFDAASWDRADIVQGRNASVLVRWVAPADLTDGTVEVDLPAHDWQTPLHPEGRLNPEVVVPGSAAVRPSSGEPSPDPAACPWSGEEPEVEQSDTAQIVRATHVTCSAGQYLDFRVLDVRAPDHPGQHFVQTQAWEAAAGWAEYVPFEVAHTPDVTLQVTAPRSVQQGYSFPVRITAMRDGAVATDYRGSVALTGIGPHALCNDAKGVDPVYAFTAQDAGTVVLDFAAFGADRLSARDVGNTALPGRSDRFSIKPGVTAMRCPVSYH